MRALAACLVALGLQSTAAGLPASNPQSDIRNPQSVRIDLIATDARGRLVENLTASEFELREEGVPQQIESVRFVRASAEEPRLVAVFVDEYHIARDATDRVRAALTQFVDEDLRPEDRLVVMRPLDSIFAIHLTEERDSARAAIEALAGCKGEYEARNPYERNFMAGAPTRIESARAQVALSAVNALAVHLAGVPDRRKTLIIVGDGFGGVERRRGLEYLPTIETIVRSADRANVSIYAVGPGTGDERAAETMRTLARETAGQAAGADLEDGLRRAVGDSSGYYLLTYHAAQPSMGSFHAVSVRIRRAGVQARARAGYFEPSPDDALRAALLARASEPAVVKPPEPAPHASPLIRPWFGMSRGANGNTRVTFVWEPVARLTGERVRHVPARVSLMALGADDAVLFEGVVVPTGPGTVEEAGAPAARAVFETPPGRVRLRMSIQDAAQQVVDSDVRSLAVRDLKNGIAIGTPEVLRARNAREFRALDVDAAVPVASREFSRTERLLVRFRAYGPGDAAPSVRARLRSRLGGSLRDLPVTSAGGESEVEVPLAGLAVGDYEIELSATSGAGEARDVVDFRVTT
jgi:VWFA-related protein